MTDSGKLTDDRQIARQSSTMSILHGFCDGVEISRTLIITKSLPGVQNVILRRGSERPETGESPKPLIIIRDHGRHLGLVKHQLGDEDGIWVARATPGEIPAMTAIPTQEITAKSGNLQSGGKRPTCKAERPTLNSGDHLNIER